MWSVYLNSLNNILIKENPFWNGIQDLQAMATNLWHMRRNMAQVQEHRILLEGRLRAIEVYVENAQPHPVTRLNLLR